MLTFAPGQNRQDRPRRGGRGPPGPRSRNFSSSIYSSASPNAFARSAVKRPGTYPGRRAADLHRPRGAWEGTAPSRSTWFVVRSRSTSPSSIGIRSAGAYGNGRDSNLKMSRLGNGLTFAPGRGDSRRITIESHVDLHVRRVRGQSSWVVPRHARPNATSLKTPRPSHDGSTIWTRGVDYPDRMAGGDRSGGPRRLWASCPRANDSHLPVPSPIRGPCA
jgi:hypothetical protein